MREADEHRKPVTGWSKTDYLTAGDNSTVQLQVKFAKAGYYTIQFNVKFPPSGIAYRLFVLADITWTVAGNPITRTISVMDGTTISGMGEAVAVSIRDWSDSADAVFGPYLVSCSVAEGSRPGTASQPTYAANMEFNPPPSVALGRGLPGVLTMGGSQVIELLFPPGIGANALYLGVSPGSMTTPNVVIPDPAMFRVDWRDVILGSLAFEQYNTWIPLIPGAVGITLTSGPLGFGENINVQPILGIEG